MKTVTESLLFIVIIFLGHINNVFSMPHEEFVDFMKDEIRFCVNSIDSFRPLQYEIDGDHAISSIENPINNVGTYIYSIQNNQAIQSAQSIARSRTACFENAINLLKEAVVHERRTKSLVSKVNASLSLCSHFNDNSIVLTKRTRLSGLYPLGQKESCYSDSLQWLIQQEQNNESSPINRLVYKACTVDFILLDSQYERENDCLRMGFKLSSRTLNAKIKECSYTNPSYERNCLYRKYNEYY